MERAGSCDYGQLATGQGQLCQRGHVEIPLVRGGRAKRQRGERNGDQVSRFRCFHGGDGASYDYFFPPPESQLAPIIFSLTLHFFYITDSFQRQR